MNTYDKSAGLLKVGTLIRDNDPRMTGRVLAIFELHGEYVWTRAYRGGGGVYRILRRRIHTDGKPRRNGFSIVPGGAA